MCECPCGEFVPFEAFQIGDKYLAIEIYPGCETCKTGVMVTLALMSEEQKNDMDIEIAPPLEPDKGDGWDQREYRLFTQEDMIEAAKDMIEASKEIIDVSKEIDPQLGFTSQEYENLEDLISDMGMELVRTAIHKRLEAMRAEVDHD